MKPPESPIFAAVAKILFFVLNALAAHLLWRGHNLPGGGFIGGLVTAISLVTLGLAVGWEGMGRWLRFDPAWLAFVGIPVAALTGIAPMLRGGTFLEHRMWHLTVPGIGELHLGTALGFDVGVYLVVVGVAAKLIVAFGRAIDGLPAFGHGEEARYASILEEPIENPVAGAPSGPGGVTVGEAGKGGRDAG